MAGTDDLKAALKAAGFDLSKAEDRQSLARIVGCQPDDLPALTDRLQKVQTLALTEWLGWAAARQRYSSLSELDTSRVLNLFLTIRQAPPTVELLVEQLAIPQGRATSMIGRMKYGQARELTRLSFVDAAREVQKRLATTKEANNRKAITVSREIIDRLQDVEFAIFSDADAFPRRENLIVAPSGRLGGTVLTSSPMWNYVVAELTKRGTP